MKRLLLFIVALLPAQVSGELWLCEGQTETRAIFTDRPTGNCQKHSASGGSVSYVPGSYFELAAEEHLEFVRNSPAAKLIEKQVSKADSSSAVDKKKKKSRRKKLD